MGRRLAEYADLCLMALKTLYDDMKEGGPNKFGLQNKIKLIYIDLPFATKKDFMKDKEKAYRDEVIGSQFIGFLRKRLIFLRDILPLINIIHPLTLSITSLLASSTTPIS